MILQRTESGETNECGIGPGGSCAVRDLAPGEYTVRVEVPGYTWGPSTKRVVHVGEAGPEFELRLHEAGTLAGTVRGPAGGPVAGARIQAVIKGGARWTGRTGRDGTYAFSVLPGTVEVACEHPDFAPAFPGRAVVAPGARVLVDVTLSAGFALEGVVLSLEGRPLEEASVALQETGPTPDLMRIRAPVRVAKDGTFAFLRLGEGKHVLGAGAPGRARTFRTVIVPREPGAPPLEIRLGEGFGFRGTLVDTAGRGIAGAKVRVDPDAGGEGGEATTGPEGRFFVGGLPAAPLKVSASASGFVPLVGVPADPQAGPFEAVLVRTGSIRGRVVFEGAGQEGAAVLARASPALRFRTYTAPGGGFRFEALSPGAYMIEIADAGFEGRAGPVRVVEGGDADAGEIELFSAE
jgi:protocatechuate 3,4-dioxygenase beta subunit